MKIQIRRKCFETNSSSVHAICVVKDGEERDYQKHDLEYSLECARDGYSSYILIEHKTFGWENECYCEPKDKLDYLCQAVCCVWEYNDTKMREACKFISDVLDKYHFEHGFEKMYFKKRGLETGYIDHYSRIPIEWVIKCTTDEDYLLKYLFGGAMVITGNDNEEFIDCLLDLVDRNRYDVYEKGN